MRKNEYPLGTTFVDFKIISDIDGSNMGYGYLLSNAEMDFYDYYLGEENLTGLVDMGLEPLHIIDTLIAWYPEIESCLRTYGVVLNGELIKGR